MALGLHDCPTLRTVEIFEFFAHIAFIDLAYIRFDGLSPVARRLSVVPVSVFTDLRVNLLALSIDQKCATLLFTLVGDGRLQLPGSGGNQLTNHALGLPVIQ